MPNRRDFLKVSAGTGALVGLLPASTIPATLSVSESPPPAAPLALPPPEERVDLSPGAWIWYPSGRTLPNTVILFRHGFRLPSPARSASGWIAADSRYLLSVNGRRVQWGPAPSDPRRMEVDPLELSELLQTGDNAIGTTVLYYGHGDGTHPIGKPGFAFSLSIECTDGTTLKIASDPQWRCHLATSWPPGGFKRWYIRAFQEEFDARRYPYGWDTPSFTTDADWIPAMLLSCPPTLPPICSRYPDDLMETSADRSVCCLLPRSIPLIRESSVPVRRLTEAFALTWKRPAAEYFAMVTPDAYSQEACTENIVQSGGAWQVRLERDRSIALTFELDEQVVGFPEFSIDAPAGTIIELLVHEAHQPGGPALLNTHFHAWARFICREGTNSFRTMDYESVRWLQLHIRGPEGVVTVRNPGVLRRIYPWPQAPRITCSEPPLQRLMDACLNTLNNSAQETIVDGMGRERQQYSGDGSHQMHGIYLALGDHRLPARFVQTFSQGQVPDGYFLDCWPAYDRLARVMERQIDLTIWGPLLDHGVGFVFDCYHHWLYTGDLRVVREPFARLQRFVSFLHRIQGPDGLLPVTHLGTPNVWMDHYAYKQQRHKQCAFNLYAAAMLRSAFVPLARAMGNDPWVRFAQGFSERILNATRRTFWSAADRLFINNLPWQHEEHEQRLCDRSIATAVLFGLCPLNNASACVQALAECPPSMGLSYPANAGWRYWALAEGGRTDVILREFRERWAMMDSVRLNNTVAEVWNAHPDSGDLWSHCAIVPLYVTFMSIAGIRPTAPGFAGCRIRPQPGDLEMLDLTARTALGDIVSRTSGRRGARELSLRVPDAMDAHLILDPREKVALPRSPDHPDKKLASYKLPAGKEITVRLTYT